MLEVTRKRTIVKYDKGLATLTTSSPLTLAESKLVFNVVAQIDTNDEDFKKYKINASELHSEIKNELRSEARKRSKLKGKDLQVVDIAKEKKQQLEIFCKNLRSKSLNLPVENDLDFNVVGWFDSFNYKSEEDAIYCQFHPQLKPYLLDFKNNHFKKIHTPNIFRFKSKYTHKFYLLLKTNHLNDTYISIEDFGNIIPITWFRKWLGLVENNEYQKYNDFKRFILEKALKDLSEYSEVTFQYEEVKTKRAVTHLKIKVKYKDRSLPNESEIDIAPTLFDEDDLKEKHLTFDDMILRYPVVQIDNKSFKLDKVILNNNNKYEIVTDRENIVFKHKNKEKVFENVIAWRNAYLYNKN